jgi:nuclear pore complex protein Nup98-Nup96
LIYFLLGFGTNTQPSTGFGGNLFGNTQQQQQPQQQTQHQTGFGAFGKPATTTGQTTTFGGLGQPVATNTQSNLFGNTQNNTQTSTGFGNLFGAKPAPALGTTQSTTGIFGANNQTAPAPNQGSLVASINQPIGANLPIFAMLPPGPRAITLDQSQTKKKAPLFVDVPTRSPVPRVQLGGFTPANSKLRGFGSSTSSHLLASSGLSFSSGKPNALSMSRQVDGLTPDSFKNGRSSPSLGSGERRSVKKLVLDKKVEATDLFSRSGSTPGLRSKVSFSPALSVAARETAAQSASPMIESPTPASRAQRTSNRFTAAPSTVIDGDSQSGASGLK